MFKLLHAQAQSVPPLSLDCQTEQTRERHTQRTVSVFVPPVDIDPAWVGVQRVIQVERQGTRDQIPFRETVFYISSLTLEAAAFAQGIRHHWQIENCLHWVKDKVLQEDSAPVCDGHALTNFAIVRTIAVNLFRANGFASVTKGIRQLARDIPRLFSFFQ